MSTETLVNTDQIWKEVCDIINKLYSHDKFLHIEYQVLIKHVFTICSTKDRSTEDNSNERVDTGLIGAKLYELIQELLKNYLDDLKRTAIDYTDEEEIITFIATKWKSYKNSTKILNKVCDYLNRNWIIKQRDNGRLEIYKIYHLAYVLWKNIILTHFYISAINGALKLIERERKGLLIDSRLITNLIDCIVLVELKEDETEDLTSYKDNFERLFLEDTEKFYNNEGTNYLQNNPVTEYLKKIEQRLAEEQKRLKENLHETSNEILIKTCERSLIQRHLSTFEEEFKQLLKLNKNKDMERMYLLVARNPEDLDRFIRPFYVHVLSEGLSAIKNCQSASIDVENYGITILTAYKKYFLLVSNVFKDNTRFAEAFHEAFTQVINNNETVSSEKSSLFLAQYCDVLIRKSNPNMETSELKDTFRYLIHLYNIHNQKDVFENHYFKLFANRLMQNTSGGDDVEDLMISTMESKRFVTKYTKTLRNMQDEVKKSEQLSKELQRTNVIGSKEFSDTVSVKVLTPTLWKIKQFPTIRLPDEFQVHTSKLLNFYAEKEPHKQLKVCYNLCHGKVVTNHLKKNYNIQANLVQISILLQFNKSSRWMLSELVNQTHIEMEYLLPSLEVLIKRKLLRCSETNLKPNSIISLNEEYTNSKSYIHLDIPIKMLQENPEKFDENYRKQFIQSKIIFIMKKHRVLQHQELFNQVSNSISHFKLNVINFNECIAILVEKEYLEHSDVEGSYRYLP